MWTDQAQKCRVEQIESENQVRDGQARMAELSVNRIDSTNSWQRTPANNPQATTCLCTFEPGRNRGRPQRCEEGKGFFRSTAGVQFQPSIE